MVNSFETTSEPTAGVVGVGVGVRVGVSVGVSVPVGVSVGVEVGTTPIAAWFELHCTPPETESTKIRKR